MPQRFDLLQSSVTGTSPSTVVRQSDHVWDAGLGASGKPEVYPARKILRSPRPARETVSEDVLNPFDAIVIGTSLGGLKALETILPGLPAAFSIPILVVQHRYPEVHSSLSYLLQQYSALPIVEAEDKQPIQSGTIYLAPPDYHLQVEINEQVSRPHLSLSVDDPVCFARPSIDVLFESAADVYQSRLLSLLLTGASRDGAAGLGKIRASGGVAIVQDPTTAVCPTMPNAAIAMGVVDQILPLEQIAPFLVRVCCANRN